MMSIPYFILAQCYIIIAWFMGDAGWLFNQQNENGWTAYAILIFVFTAYTIIPAIVWTLICSAFTGRYGPAVATVLLAVAAISTPIAGA